MIPRRARHAAILSHPAGVAPGALPRRPPQRVSAGRVSRDSSRDRLWSPRRGALSPLCAWLARLGVTVCVSTRGRTPFALPPSLNDHPQAFWGSSPHFPGHRSSMSTVHSTDGGYCAVRAKKWDHITFVWLGIAELPVLVYNT
jgi:hypothetical protein